MNVTRVVVIGASSGGIDALRSIAGALPPDFPAAICVVLHLSPDSPGLLGRILDAAGPLSATEAVSGDRLQPGHIHVAPPDHHLLLEPNTLRLSRGPRENRFRPAIDPLFRSAAQVYGPAAIGVVLTGHLDDGAAGLQTIGRLGGVTIVQDPADALFPSMPANALRHGPPDHCVPLSEIPPLLVRLTQSAPDAASRVPVPAEVAIEVNIAREENPMEAGLAGITEPSPFACPECHGVLMRVQRAKPERFRCHTGHGYSAESLVAAVSEGVEGALWNAVRALSEAALLLAELSVRQQEDGHDDAARLEARARDMEAQAALLRDMLSGRRELPTR